MVQGGVGKGVMGKKDIMGWVWMEVVGREHAMHNQEGLAMQRDMPEHFLCARWERC